MRNETKRKLKQTHQGTLAMVGSSRKMVLLESRDPTGIVKKKKNERRRRRVNRGDDPAVLKVPCAPK